MPGQRDSIDKELSTLTDYGVLTDARHNEIMTALDGLGAGTPLSHQYSQSLSDGLPGVTQGVIDLIYARESGDPFAISIASIGIFQGFVTMAGPMLGPVGALASALTGMLTSILSAFLPPPPSLKEEIEAVLNKFQQQEKKFDLGSAEDQISIFIHSLETAGKKGESTAWTPLNLLDGEQVKAIDAAWQWLSEREKQSLPYWGELLDLNCQVFAHLLRAVTMGIAYPSKIQAIYTWQNDKGETVKITPGELMNVHLQSRCEKFLQKARRVKPVAQDRGMLFQLSSSGGPIYVGDHIQEGRNALLGGFSIGLSVAVSQSEIGSEDPVYHLLRLQIDSQTRSSCLSHRELSAPYTEQIKEFKFGLGPILPDSGQAKALRDDPELSGIYDVWGMTGGDQRLDTNPKEKSIGSEKSRDRIYFYTLKGKTIHGYVRDETGSLTKIYTKVVTGAELKCVRVVQGPKAVVGDPDAKIGFLQNVDYMIYGGYQGGDSIYVDYRRSPHGKNRILKDGFVRGPWEAQSIRHPLGFQPVQLPGYSGLGVDQTYLWVNTSRGFACATHASVLRCLEGEIDKPTWMIHQMDVSLPKGKQDPKGNISDLCPCDDGTLIFSLTEGEVSTGGAPLYSAAYHVNLKTRHLAVHWVRDSSHAPKRIENGAAAYRLCKVPLFCWPRLDGLIKFVEQTYPEHAAQAHTH